MKHIINSIIILLFLSSCENGINGTGENVSYTPSIGSFNSINISLPASIIIEADEFNGLEMQAQSNIINNTDIYIKNNTLYVEFDEDVNNHNPITLYLQMPQLKDIKISGACDIDVLSSYETNEQMKLSVSGYNSINFLDTIKCQDFDYNVSGTSFLKAISLFVWDEFDADISGTDNTTISHLDCYEFDYSVSGKGNIIAKGAASKQQFKVSGTINYRGLNLITNETTMNISGVGKLDINTSKNLGINVSGSAAVSYLGDPNINKKVSGFLNLTSLE